MAKTSAPVGSTRRKGSPRFTRSSTVPRGTWQSRGVFANPAECQKMKDERKARHEKMKAACKDNPKECEKRRKEMRERRQQRSDKFCAEHPEKCDGEPDEDDE